MGRSIAPKTKTHLPDSRTKATARHEAGHAAFLLALSTKPEYQVIISRWQIGRIIISKSKFLRNPNYSLVRSVNNRIDGSVHSFRSLPPHCELAYLLAGDAAEGRSHLHCNDRARDLKNLEHTYKVESDFRSIARIVMLEWKNKSLQTSQISAAIKECYRKVQHLFTRDSQLRTMHQALSQYMLTEILRRHGSVHSDLLMQLNQHGIREEQLMHICSRIEDLGLQETVNETLKSL